jgi:hypothetical protein
LATLAGMITEVTRNVKASVSMVDSTFFEAEQENQSGHFAIFEGLKMRMEKTVPSLQFARILSAGGLRRQGAVGQFAGGGGEIVT